MVKIRKKNKWIQLFCAPLVLISLLQITCITTFAQTAAGSSEGGSLTIVEGNSTLKETYPDIVVTIYKVGSFDLDALEVRYTLTKEFADAGIAINNLSTTTQNIGAANKLTTYSKNKNIQSTARITTKSDGVATFSELDKGLYLVIASANSGKTITSSPFLIAVPFVDSDSWIYNVTAYPKYTEYQMPIASHTLPQTGQKTIYIYIVATVGELLIILGVLFIIKKRKHSVKNHEK